MNRVSRMADRQFHTYGGMPNRPPDILAPDLVNANADYHGKKTYK